MRWYLLLGARSYWEQRASPLGAPGITTRSKDATSNKRPSNFSPGHIDPIPWEGHKVKRAAQISRMQSRQRQSFTCPRVVRRQTDPPSNDYIAALSHGWLMKKSSHAATSQAAMRGKKGIWVTGFLNSKPLTPKKDKSLPQ